MHYGKIKTHDISNGPGVRVSLFVSGCRNQCPGCFNPETWDFYYGEPFTSRTVFKILNALAPDHIAGLSVLGGDPFEPENLSTVTTLVKTVKQTYPNKSVWVYTGYRFENLIQHEIMQYIDVLVDGPYSEKYRDLHCRFRGSTNQRMIKVPETLSTGMLTIFAEGV